MNQVANKIGIIESGLTGITRTIFHKELREIQDDIFVMGSMVGKAIMLTITALQNRDLTLAKQIITDDQKINHKRFEIEEKCIQLMSGASR